MSSHQHAAANAHAVSEGVALKALWGSLRLAVLDTETCNAADGDHVIDIAVITCRGQREVGSWQRMVNPGVPIDAASQQTHGITDEQVAGAETFPSVIPELTRVLTAADGEQLVLVAHNAPFDVGRLHLEFERAGQRLPDLPVLDTRALAKYLRLPDGTLSALLEALTLVNTQPHSGEGDARATAKAALAMLTLAARTGEHDFDALLARVMHGRKARTRTIKAAGRSRRRPDPVPEQGRLDLPAEHLVGHSVLLPDAPSRAALDGWVSHIRECVRLRCPYLSAWVEVAQLPSAQILELLTPVLDEALTRTDAPAAATLLGALSPRLEGLPDRAAALKWHKRWGARLDSAGACGDGDSCPDCQAALPCPLDTWQQPLAAVALGRIDGKRQAARSFLHTQGAGSGTGVFTTWHATGHGRLADHAAWLVHEHWRATGQHLHALSVARYAWTAGGRDPRLAAVHARNVATPGSVETLQRGIDICAEALFGRSGSTDDGWHDLLATRGRLAGQLARRRFKPSGAIDTNGNPIPIRRHHPATPERSRRGRFQMRDGNATSQTKDEWPSNPSPPLRDHG
jgi:DNA polymerase III epsilon subunit-like protein